MDYVLMMVNSLDDRESRHFTCSTWQLCKRQNEMLYILLVNITMWIRSQFKQYLQKYHFSIYLFIVQTTGPAINTRVGVNSAPELDFLANSKSNSGIGIELELALPSPGGIGIELELPSFELELESELHSSELNSELPSWS